MKRFNPLFTLNYSATHKTKHNLIYALDAVDAYRQKLVKQIEVKGFEVKSILGTSRFLALEKIEPTESKPIAWISHDIRKKTGQGAIRRARSKLKAGDSLYAKSLELNEYEHFIISSINVAEGIVEFQNGVKLRIGQVIGDPSQEEIQRIQLRETVSTHFEREKKLWAENIKTLSLFFIDEVANYRAYGEDGSPLKAKFQDWFEDAYRDERSAMLATLNLNDPHDKAYADYLNRFEPEAVHAGYFSVDKKGRSIDSKSKRGEGSDDVDAYDLILRDKERLLSFEEPVRFIFSHSALQEGWDNPNIFQICTLRATNSTIKKRQEVGRGLRLCVNADGYRQDASVLGNRVHDVNVLTVIANENYKDFVTALQKETRETLRERPEKVTEELFAGRTLKLTDGSEHLVTPAEAQLLLAYFTLSEYIDAEGRITSTYKVDQKQRALKPLPSAKGLDPVRPFEEAVHQVVKSTYDSTLDSNDWISNGLAPAKKKTAGPGELRQEGVPGALEADQHEVLLHRQL